MSDADVIQAFIDKARDAGVVGAWEATVALRNFGKRLHDEIRTGFEHRLLTMQQAVSAKDRKLSQCEHNLTRAAGKREDSQDRLHLAIRQLRERDEELARLNSQASAPLIAAAPEMAEMLSEWYGLAGQHAMSSRLVARTGLLLHRIRGEA
jgi:hypothetical protein